MFLEPILAYNLTSLPGKTVSEQFQLASREGLAVEVAHQEDFPVEVYQKAEISISAVQAYGMHDFHPLHRDRTRRDAAFRHVQATLELAAKLAVPRIVTVCGFGYELADSLFQRCLDFFSSFSTPAKALGIRIMIEPLSPKRAGALTNPEDIAQLITALNEPEVFSILLDTGHLLDSGFELNSFFENWKYPIEELQLKGFLSAPPPLTMPVQKWIQSLPQPPAVVCVEHRQSIGLEDFEKLVGKLREEMRLTP